MPILKSAIKKLRADRKKQTVNKVVRTKATGLVTSWRKSVSAEKLPEVFAAIDKAAKKKIFHKNKADRLKSRLTKMLSKKK